MEIKSIMDSVIRTLTPYGGLGTAGRTFEEAGVSVLPVVDADGKVTGTLTLHDVNEALGRTDASPASEAIETIMSREALTCLSTDDVKQMAEKAERLGVTHAIILDELGEVQGVADLSPYQGKDDDNDQGDDSGKPPRGKDPDSSLDDALQNTFPASDPISPP